MPTSQVINAGIGGNNTRDLLGRIESDVLAHNPTLVCLMAGTNDRLNSHNEVPVSEYRENIRRLASLIRDTGSGLLCMTVLPCYEPYLVTRHDPAYFADMAPNARVREINAFLHAFTTDEGIPLVDLHTPYAALGEIGEEPMSLLRNIVNSGEDDGIHPTAEGYRLIAALVYAGIQAHALPTERIVCFGDSITKGAHMPGEGSASGHTYPGWLARMFDIEPDNTK